MAPLSIKYLMVIMAALIRGSLVMFSFPQNPNTLLGHGDNSSAAPAIVSVTNLHYGSKERLFSEANMLEMAPNPSLDLTSNGCEETIERSRQGGEATHDLDPMMRRVAREKKDNGMYCRIGIKAFRSSVVAAVVVEAILPLLN